MPFKLWPDQITLARRLPAERLLVILKARQLGISWLVCAYVLHLCLFHPGKVALLFSQGQDEANELLRRIAVLYDRLPAGLKAVGPALKRSNTSELAWANGSRIESLPATQRAGRSFTASLVVMDEAAHMQWGARLYAAAKPTMDDGGQLIVLSTANGAGGFFHTLWSKAVARVNGFATAFLPWWSRPGRDQAWYDRKLAEATDPDLIKQEFPADETEAFIASGRVRFASAWIAAQAANIESGLPARDLPTDLRAIEGLTVYRLPGQVKADFLLIPADVAEGLEGGDYSTAPVLGVSADGTRAEELACVYGSWEPDEFGVILHALSEAYKAGIAVERNNHGFAVLTKLRDLGSTRILNGHDGRSGWTTTPATKPQAVDALAVALRDGGAVVRSQATLNEMRDYRKLGGGKTGAPEGMHDDRVMSWAVGLGWLLLCKLPERGRPIVGGARPHLPGTAYRR
jgi:Terminase large subunit, T4likevirus-type, N-terminal